MRQGWSVGILMIAMGGIGISGFGQQHAAGKVPYALATLLVVGGASMFLRRPFAFFIAMAAAVLLVISGALGFLHHPEWALPVPPALSLVIGLYLCLRTVMARPSLNPPRKRAFLPDPPDPDKPSDA